MENLALFILEWIGKIIAQRLAGSAISAAWKRISPPLADLLKSSQHADKDAA